ncbi:tetratricopeptide repeat protein [Amphritea balenae]|nr:tetratricopeptide repeat protein [Amphritea balenae]
MIKTKALFNRALVPTLAVSLLCSAVTLNAADTSDSFCQSAGAENNFDCSQSQNFQANQKDIDAKLNELNRWLQDEELSQAGTQANISQPQSGKLKEKIAFNSQLLASELKQARKLQSQGNTQAAFDQVDNYLINNPKDPNGWLLYGTSLMNQNKLDAAADIFNKLIQLYPDSPEPYNNLAAVYARQGKNDKAVDTLLQAFDTHPSYAQVQANLKAVYATLATQAYNRALDLDKSSDPARANLAILDQVYQAPGAAPQTLQISETATPKQQPLVKPATEITEPVIEERDISEGIVPVIDDKPVNETSVAITQKNDDKSDSSTVAVVATTEPATTQTSISEPGTPEETTTLEGSSSELTASKEDSSEAAAPVTGTAIVQSTSELTDQINADIEVLINGWANAWSSQSVQDYLGFYTSQYSPSSEVTHEEWVWGRNKRLSKPTFIKVDISDISLAKMENDKIRSVFKQTYQSNTYKDSVYKTLIFTKENGSWKIMTETTL